MFEVQAEYRKYGKGDQHLGCVANEVQCCQQTLSTEVRGRIRITSCISATIERRNLQCHVSST